MSAAVRKLTEQAEALGKATAVMHAVGKMLDAFRELSTVDPQSLFGHTVSVHQQWVEKFDMIIVALCHGGRGIEAIASDVGLGKDSVTIIRAAHLKLRVLRTLAAVLSGDSRALDNEQPDVRAEVERAISERGAANARMWTTGERAAFEGDARPLSLAFEARLNGS